MSVLLHPPSENSHDNGLTQPMDPEIKSLNFISPTKHVIPESLKFSHWLSEREGSFYYQPKLHALLMGNPSNLPYICIKFDPLQIGSI